jgi:pilus assembly protein CpaE
VAQPVKTLIALESGSDHRAIQDALDLPSEIQIVGFVDGLEESWNALQETPADLLLIGCAGYSDRVLFLIDGAVKQKRERPVVVLCDGPSNGFVRRAFEAGADDFITLPESPQSVAFALQKAMARKQSTLATTSLALAPLVCVVGPKGGAGKTVTTCNLAVAVAARGKRAVVVDLDLQFGDVGLSLGLAPEKTIHDLAKSGGSLDSEKIDAYLAKHPSGVRVLMAPTRPDQAGVITAEFLREVYAILRATYDFVLVDTPPGFTPEVISTIDSSSDICMVGTLDVLSLKNTKLGLETLELMGYDANRIKLVLNRAGTRVGITREDVVAIVGRPPDVLVPSDRDIARSVNEGSPIVASKSKSEAGKAFRMLADSYVDRDIARTNGKKTGVRLFRRKK